MSSRKIIGLKGPKDSGKTTAAKYLTSKYGYEEFYFSEPLKEIICILTGWSYAFVNGETPEYKEQRETLVHPDFGMTCRQLLQTIGTDLFRNHFDREVWVKIMRRKINEYDGPVIFSDIRFKEEADLITELGGTIIRLVRDTGIQDTHESEQLFDTLGEKIILNNGNDLEELYAKIDLLIS